MESVIAKLEFRPDGYYVVELDGKLSTGPFESSDEAIAFYRKELDITLSFSQEKDR